MVEPGIYRWLLGGTSIIYLTSGGIIIETLMYEVIDDCCRGGSAQWESAFLGRVSLLFLCKS